MNFRGQFVAPEVMKIVTDAVIDTVRNFESGESVVVPPVVLSFIQVLVFESVFLHQEEWRGRTDLPLGYRNLDPSKDSDALKIEEVVHDSLKKVLGECRTEAEPRSPGGRDQVSATSLVKVIHRRWCQIFPFCR